MAAVPRVYKATMHRAMLATNLGRVRLGAAVGALHIWQADGAATLCRQRLLRLHHGLLVPAVELAPHIARGILARHGCMAVCVCVEQGMFTYIYTER